MRALFLGGAAAPAPPPTPGRRPTAAGLSEQEARIIKAFADHYGVTFRSPDLLKLALTHRSYLSVTGQGPRESNERLEFLGDSVLGLVTSEFLYRAHPNEHEGQLTKTKSLLVSKAILSRRALAMGLGRFVLMSHSEVESGGRQRMSIIADAFESVVGAIYIDQGFEAARTFIERWLLKDSREIVADKRHTNYKSHLQEYVQSTFRTHPVYRIRSQIGPDHSKQFNVEVMVSRRVLGSGQGRNKKEAEQAAARNALEQVEGTHRARAAANTPAASRPAVQETPTDSEAGERERRRRGRRGGRGRRPIEEEARRDPTATTGSAPASGGQPGMVEAPAERRERSAPRERRPAPPPVRQSEPRVREPEELEPLPRSLDEFEEVGRPEGPLEERHVDPYETLEEPRPRPFEQAGGSGQEAFVASPEPESDERDESNERTMESPDSFAETETDAEVRGTETRAESPPRGAGVHYGRRSGRSKRPHRPG